MRFTFHATMCQTDHYIPLAKAVEELGFHGFTFPDSICYPEVANTKYPYNADGSRNFLEGLPFLEPFCAIPALGAVTERIRFTTSVVKLPIRNPVLVAKQTATVACMTNNRFALGVGISPWVEDFQICGERWEGRGKRMDEMVDIIRGLMTGEYYGYDSEFYQIPACKICPVPDQPVPILIGGHADPALKRAALIGDGWVHAGGDAETLKTFIDRINAYRKEFGTDNRPFEFHAITADAFSVDGVKKLEEAGVTECIVGFRDAYAGDPDDKTVEQKIDILKWFQDNIIQHCGDPV
ncbi:MAG: TIGR03619 family F420-dependent LLM class oxidoreductase [Pseudomonadales bacterium]|nr:TIGR03619 family F420-dependent LLM class oxidoreductase [Pseudomonadales bacterium]